MSSQPSLLRGLLEPDLFLGVVSSVTAQAVGVNLSEAGRPTGSHFMGTRYGRGEVGELVLIEGQQSLILGRVTEVYLRENDRRTIKRDFAGNSNLDALGRVQLLGHVHMDDLRVMAGVDVYPRLGDRIYSAPHRFIALLPQLMERHQRDDLPAAVVTLDVGTIDAGHETAVTITPERLFGRHCAILGATGGGKSWTMARIIEESIKFDSKLILIDATGEYRGFSGDTVTHCHLDTPTPEPADGSVACSLPPSSFIESDFVALFEPAGKVQGPKLREAIRSLRLAKLFPSTFPKGYVPKHGQPKRAILDLELSPGISTLLDDPRQEFDPFHLVEQIEQECVWPNGTQSSPNSSVFGGRDDSSYANCLPLFTRINGALNSPALACIFKPGNAPSLTDVIENFVNDKNARLLRIDLSGVSYEYHAREIIANVIGRHLLTTARKGTFRKRPIVVMVDEAHNFLGRYIGTDDYATSLDAFELIAKEGRKYGLTICLSSQRPRDITEDVLSQIGTLIVHRLTNDQDRAVVERACGEIDRAVSAFLPSLRQGEAAIIGIDFPIPLTIRVHRPTTEPASDGPRYQEQWGYHVASQQTTQEAAPTNELLAE